MDNKTASWLTTKTFDTSEAEKTIVVSGVARSGTSMVAAVLRGLGISMGVGLNMNHEDIDFYNVLNNRLDIAVIRELVRSRNEKHKVWGFKSPLLVENAVIPTIVPELRNPLVIVVFRNIIGYLLSTENRDNIGSPDGFRHYIKGLQCIETLLQSANYPILGVNYEEATKCPQEFTALLAELAGLGSEAAILDVAATLISGSGGGYVLMPDEERKIDLIDPGDLGDIRELSYKMDLGSVMMADDMCIFYGDIFDGEDNLVRFSPSTDNSFGQEVYFQLVISEKSYEMGEEERASRAVNVYFLLGDEAYSLGVSLSPIGRSATSIVSAQYSIFLVLRSASRTGGRRERFARSCHSTSWGQTTLRRGSWMLGLPGLTRAGIAS